jgi:hypothetical protein
MTFSRTFRSCTKVHNAEIKKTDIHEHYQIFLLKNEKDLETQFTEKVDFHTNVRGVKVRRVFSELGECQQVREDSTASLPS